MDRGLSEVMGSDRVQPTKEDRVYKCRQNQQRRGQNSKSSHQEVQPDSSSACRILKLALAMLARREYSARELATKLTQKGFASEQISALLADLQSQGWQSDQRFGQAWLLSKVRAGYGPRYIKYELLRQGLSPTLVQNLLAEAEAKIDWLAQIRQVYERHLRRSGGGHALAAASEASVGALADYGESPLRDEMPANYGEELAAIELTAASHAGEEAAVDRKERFGAAEPFISRLQPAPKLAKRARKTAKSLASLKGLTPLQPIEQRQYRQWRFLLTRGFEPDQIKEVLDERQGR